MTRPYRLSESLNLSHRTELHHHQLSTHSGYRSAANFRLLLSRFSYWTEKFRNEKETSITLLLGEKVTWVWRADERWPVLNMKGCGTLVLDGTDWWKHDYFLENMWKVTRGAKVWPCWEGGRVGGRKLKAFSCSAIIWDVRMILFESNQTPTPSRICTGTGRNVCQVALQTPQSTFFFS